MNKAVTVYYTIMRLYALLFISLLIASAAWTGENPQSGAADSSPSGLETVLKNPAAYQGKTIILEGNFAKRNCKYCFMYKEGLDSVKIEPQGFDSPDFAPGTPVRIKGRVQVKENGEVSVEAGSATKR